MPKGKYLRKEPMIRFWEKVDTSGQCWLWMAGTDRDGYGQFKVKGFSYRAHRWLWEQVIGPIRNQLDHLCRVTNCVRPDHLEDVTLQVNVARGLAGSRNKYGLCKKFRYA